MPKIIPFSSLRNSLVIGASAVAAITHLDPWKSDWELWLEKSGRRSKPPRTPQMQFGIDMESTAMAAYYKAKGIEPMQEQVAALHPDYPYLCAVVDGWNGEYGVNVKVPSSQKVIAMAAGDEFESDWDDEADIDFARVKHIPRPYQIQCAAEMAVFGADHWDYAVYDAESGLIHICPITWGDIWDVKLKPKTSDEYEYVTLREFWQQTAIPLVERFMAHLESGEEWENRPETPMPDATEWQEAATQYIGLRATINELKEERLLVRAKLKTMMGSRTFISVGGYKASDKVIPASWGVKITADSEAELGAVKKALEPLAEAEGVKEIKDANRNESRRFDVRPLSAKDVAKEPR